MTSTYLKDSTNGIALIILFQLKKWWAKIYEQINKLICDRECSFLVRKNDTILQNLNGSMWKKQRIPGLDKKEERADQKAAVL